MDMDSKLRLLYMAKLLYELTDENHYLSTSQITKLLEENYSISSHRQTIKRDIEVLQSFGLDIKTLKSTQNLYHIVSRKFDTAELRLLIDAVGSAKFITQKKSQELKDKLCSLAGSFQAQVLQESSSMQNLKRSENEKIYLIIDTINEAMNKKKKISFRYSKFTVSPEGRIMKLEKSYSVSPLRLVWNGDHYYLIAIKFGGERRNFRVDRISSLPEILKLSSCPVPEDFKLDEYLNRTYRMYDAEEKSLVLKCDNSVIDPVIDRFGIDADISPCNDGSFILKADVAVSPVFLGKVFSYGGLIKIISPEDVKQKFNDMLSEFL